MFRYTEGDRAPSVYQLLVKGIGYNNSAVEQKRSCSNLSALKRQLKKMFLYIRIPLQQIEMF